MAGVDHDRRTVEPGDELERVRQRVHVRVLAHHRKHRLQHHHDVEVDGAGRQALEPGAAPRASASCDEYSSRGPVEASTPGAPSSAAASSIASAASIDPVPPHGTAGPIDTTLDAASPTSSSTRRAVEAPRRSTSLHATLMPSTPARCGRGGVGSEVAAEQDLRDHAEAARGTTSASGAELPGERGGGPPRRGRVARTRRSGHRRTAGSSARGSRRGRRTSSGRRTPRPGTDRRRSGPEPAACGPARARPGRGGVPVEAACRSPGLGHPVEHHIGDEPSRVNADSTSPFVSP